MKQMIDMNTQERRQYERDTVDAIMAARQATTATQATGKRVTIIGPTRPFAYGWCRDGEIVANPVAEPEAA